MRACNKCGVEKPRTPEFFYRQATCADGMRLACKVCDERRHKAQRQEARDPDPLPPEQLDLPMACPTPDSELEWKSRAECRGMEPSMFWPSGGNSRLPDALRRACAVCPVSRECDELGLLLSRAFGTPVGGVWGGRIHSRSVTRGNRLEGSGGVRGTAGAEEVPHVDMPKVWAGV